MRIILFRSIRHLQHQPSPVISNWNNQYIDVLREGLRKRRCPFQTHTKIEFACLDCCDIFGLWITGVLNCVKKIKQPIHATKTYGQKEGQSFVCNLDGLPLQLVCCCLQHIALNSETRSPFFGRVRRILCTLWGLHCPNPSSVLLRLLRQKLSGRYAAD